MCTGIAVSEYYMKYQLKLVSRFLLILLSSLLFACGGGGGSSSSSKSDDSDSSSEPSPTNISGSAIKGVISNAIVNAYAVDNGAKSNLLVSTTTDDNGDYSVRINGRYNGPVLLEITAKEDGTSLMLCDSAAGCGSYMAATELDTNNNNTIDFGEKFQLDTSFTLKALVPSNLTSSKNLNADITIVTHLAAAYAATFPQGYDNLSAEMAITQIASIFSIGQNPLNLSIPSINDTESFAAATNDEKLYALIASSLANLADSSSLATSVNSLASVFSLNQGQLLNNSSEEADVTLEKLLNAAVTNLNKLIAELPDTDLSIITSQLNSLLTTATNAPSDSVTNGEASPTAGSSELEKIEQFIADMQSWQGAVSATSTTNPLIEEGATAARLLNQAHSPLLQAFALASQHSAIVAVPDLAIDAACNSLGNIFMVLLCQSLVGNKTIEEICEQALNLTLFGKSMCELLNDLTLPVANGVWVTYALYDGTARVYGELEGVTFDVLLENPNRSKSTISFDVNGSISDSQADITIEGGKVYFKFPGGLSSKSLRMPDYVNLALEVSSTANSDADNADFSGEITGSIVLEKILGEGQTGVNGVSINTAHSGEFSVNSNPTFSAVIESDNSDSLTQSVIIGVESDDYSNQGTLSYSAPKTGEFVDTYRLTWGGSSYDFTTDPETPDLVQIQNQDNVAFSLNLSADDEALAGTIDLNDATYAEMFLVNGSVLVRLPNNTETFLY